MVLYADSSPRVSSFFFSMRPPPPRSTLFPYTTLFRSLELTRRAVLARHDIERQVDEIHDLGVRLTDARGLDQRSEEHTSELQSPDHLVCRLLLEKKKQNNNQIHEPA